jgi:hypothetical protein
VRIIRILALAAALAAFVGCGEKTAPEKAPKEGKEAEKKAPEQAAAPGVAFAVASCTNTDPATAAKTAAQDAIEGLPGPAKGLVFYEYFPKTVAGDEGKEVELPDAEKEKAVLPAIRAVAGDIPVIGCRARSLVNAGTMLKNTVSCLAIGGETVTCQVAKAELADDRKAVGTAIAEGLEGLEDLKLVLALSEMRLSFETKEGVSVEDFIRGVLETAGKEVTLFGGNCMPNNPNDPGQDRAGMQFINDETLEGHVVAMGISGPIAVHANHTNEFVPSTETVTVTKVAEDDNKWVLEFDGKPAAQVYREVRGMKEDEEFTSDWQHPIGVIVSEDKVYLRMILAWDKEGKEGGLKFVAPVPVGTKVKILKGGADADKILASAREGIVQSLYKAGDAEPLAVLLSDCCARGARLRKFREGKEDEITDAIGPALKEKAEGDVPIFGFYAWGELGPIAGHFQGLSCMYQQHTFVSAVITEAK